MAHLIVGQRQFQAELTPTEQVAEGVLYFKAIISCQNAEFALLEQHITQLAQTIFADFEPHIDERVRCIMQLGAQARYHVEIKGNNNQVVDFRAHFPDAVIIG